MIYGDPSFLFSLYAWDENTAVAQKAYGGSASSAYLHSLAAFGAAKRRAPRLAAYRLNRAREVARFQVGNILKRIDTDLAAGTLKNCELDWTQTLRLAEELSAAHTQRLGAAAVDLWHVAAAIALRADTFWTFDVEQRQLAEATKQIRRVPDLLTR